MERPTESGINLGTMVLAIAFILVIVFGVFMIAKNMANDGTNRLQDSVKVIQDGDFSDFDQQTISGNQIIGAIDKFKQKEVAIVVLTAEVANGIAGLEVNPKKINGVDPNNRARNYNALLANTTPLSYTNGMYLANEGFKKDAQNKTEYRLDFSPLKRDSSDSAYIIPTARFDTTLIKDKSGKILGFVAKQLEFVQ